MSGKKDEDQGKGSGRSVSRGFSSASGFSTVVGGRTVTFSHGESWSEADADFPAAGQEVLLQEIHRLTGAAADTLRVTGITVADELVTLSVRLPRDSLSEAARSALAELLLKAD